jgi:hypothetical protein
MPIPARIPLAPTICILGAVMAAGLFFGVLGITGANASVALALTPCSQSSCNGLDPTLSPNLHLQAPSYRK